MFSRTERCAVVLAPDGFSWRLLRGGRHVIAEHAVSVSAGGDNDWRETVSALAAHLGDGLRSGGRLSVLLSHQFVRPMVIPWSDDLYEDVAAQRYLRGLATDRFGSEVASWRFVLTERLRKGPRVACGVDVALLDTLREFARSRNVRLVSVQPWFAMHYDRCRRGRPSDAWQISIEPGKMLLLDRRAGDVVRIGMHSWHGEAAAAILRVLQRNQLRSGVTVPQVVEIADATGTLTPPILTEHGWRPLPGLDAPSFGTHWAGRLVGFSG